MLFKANLLSLLSLIASGLGIFVVFIFKYDHFSGGIIQPLGRAIMIPNLIVFYLVIIMLASFAPLSKQYQYKFKFEKILFFVLMTVISAIMSFITFFGMFAISYQIQNVVYLLLFLSLFILITHHDGHKTTSYFLAYIYPAVGISLALFNIIKPSDIQSTFLDHNHIIALVNASSFILILFSISANTRYIMANPKLMEMLQKRANKK